MLRTLPRVVGIVCCAVACMVLAGPPCAAEPSAELKKQIDQSISRGREWLIRADVPLPSGEAALRAYALLKSGVNSTHPIITEAVQSSVQRIRKGVYLSGPEPKDHVYEAACEVMMLVEVDPVLYLPELLLLRDYLVRKQRPNGAWFYPSVPEPAAGDTSISQFAILGLWALQRAGCEIPQSTWENAAKWFLATQKPDGTFVYQPFSNPDGNVTTRHSMTTAGTGCLFIIKRMLYPAVIIDSGEPDQPKQPRKRFGVLELTPAQNTPAKNAESADQTVAGEVIERAARKGVAWLDNNFAIRERERVLHYFLYAIERVGTLSELSKLHEVDWYDSVADYLCRAQTPAGSWEQPLENTTNPLRSTAFSLLFLSRATKSIIKPLPRVKLLGGGLQIGGRGLPNDPNTSAAQPKKSLGPIEDLLAELEKPRDANVESAQVAVIESVQLQQRDSLIGQVDRLRKLTRHPNAESRSIAYWALGRSGDIRLVPELIRGLDDTDLSVAREASLALCTLTRLVQGVPKPGQTKDLVPTDPPAGDDEFTDPDPAKVAQWRTASRLAWQAWYLQSRPYNERDDQNQIRRK